MDVLTHFLPCLQSIKGVSDTEKVNSGWRKILSTTVHSVHQSFDI